MANPNSLVSRIQFEGAHASDCSDEGLAIPWTKRDSPSMIWLSKASRHFSQTAVKQEKDGNMLMDILGCLLDVRIPKGLQYVFFKPMERIFTRVSIFEVNATSTWELPVPFQYSLDDSERRHNHIQSLVLRQSPPRSHASADHPRKLLAFLQGVVGWC